MGFTTSAGFQHEYRSLRVANIITKDVVAGQQNVERGASKEIFDTLAVQVDQAFYAQEEWLGLGERLLLTAAVRGQRSTVNGNEHTFYFFPKAAASYRLTSLPSRVDELKFRLAYGAAGNPPLLDSPFTPMTGTVYSGQNGLAVGTRRGNASIKPERTGGQLGYPTLGEGEQFLNVGGFDSRFQRAEDVELAFRLRSRGVRFVFNPDANVLHYASRSSESPAA